MWERVAMSGSYQKTINRVDIDLWYWYMLWTCPPQNNKYSILECWGLCQELVHYRPRTFIQELLAGDCWALPLLRMSTKWRKTGRHKTMDTDAGSLLPVMDFGECAVGRGPS